MHLDFEIPIVELENKLADMKTLAQQSDVDVSDAIKKLESKILKLKKETFENQINIIYPSICSLKVKSYKFSFGSKY